MSSTYSHEGITALGISMIVLGAGATAMRFYVRIKQKAPLKIDDWLLIPSFICLTGAIACAFWGIEKHVVGYPSPGKGEKPIPTATAQMTTKLYVAFNEFQMSSLGFVKLSALFFYYRIFCNNGRTGTFRIVILTTAVVVFLWTLAYMLLSVLQCGTHLNALWGQRSDQMKYCRISYPFLLSFAISDFILDFWIIAMPIPKIWRIKSTWQRRCGILGAFLLILVGFGACTARLVTYVNIAKPGPGTNRDKRLINSQAIFLSVLEGGLCLIAVNLPSLWSLISKAKPENLLRSVRSMLSLGSMGSKGSKASKGSQSAKTYPDTTQQNPSQATTSSEIYLVKNEGSTLGTNSAYDLENQNRPGKAQEVHITKSVQQTSRHF